MKGKTIVRYTREALPSGRTRWSSIGNMSEKEIEELSKDPENPKWTKRMFKEATWRMPQKKTSVHMFLDQDVVDWFKAEGRGYQSRINAVLKSYVHGHSHHVR